MRKPFAFLLVFIALSAARADIDRCDDSDGRVRYTDNASDCEIAVVMEATLPGCNGCSPPASASSSDRVEPERGLSSSFLPRAQLDPSWQAVEEAPEPIDEELKRHGLLASQARHYTRSIGPESEVCTVELWQFVRADAAENVATGLALPNWEVLRNDSLLILTHGVRLELGAGSDAGLFEDCAKLGRKTQARAARSH